MPGIGCDFQQRGGACFEQQSEEPPLVLPHQRHKRMWNAEDQVVVADRQQLQLLLGQATVACAGLAFGAVPVAAGVIRDGLMPAAHALVAVTAERSGTAAQDRIKHLALRPGQRSAIPLPEAVASVRMMSATSKGGRLIASCPAVLREARSAPAG